MTCVSLLSAHWQKAADACRARELPQVLHPARLVMFELVTDAVQHAGTDMLVTVAGREEGCIWWCATAP